MSVSFKTLWDLMILSIKRPREGARTVLALRTPQEAWWIGLVLVVVVSMVMTQLNGLLAGGLLDPMSAVLGTSVLITTAIVVGLTVGIAWLANRVGQAFGGAGTFENALRLIVWLQAILLALQIATQLALFVMPPLAFVLWVASIVIMLWLATNFIAELHGFNALLPVFLGMFGTLFVASFLLSFVLSLLGLAPPPEMQNV